LNSSSFVCQKEEARKGHPGCPVRLWRRPFAFCCCRDAENSPPAAVQTGSASISASNCDAQRDRMGPQKQQQ